MTALVLHGLVLMRDGGFDPAPAGLTCDPQREPFASACARLRATHGKVRSGDDILDAELAAACLRFAPEHEGTRAAVQYFVDAAAALPPGLLGRTGLALLAAHDRDRAQRCLALLQQNQAAGPLEPDAFPGEDPLAAQAMRLELVCALAPGDAGERDRLTFAVLQQCLAGAGSTYANGCALAALSLALPADVATPMTVVVRAGAVERSVELTAECSFTARMSLPFAATCTLTGPEDRRLLLQVVTERTERASDHAAWAMPLQVQRELCRRRPDATAEQRARGEDLLPLGAAPPRVGELLHLRVRVRSPVPMRYVVVECPLPANFEVPDPPWWIERFDDRLAFTFDRLPAGESTRTFAVVPTMVGTVVFPPAVAAPMYASGFDGGCAGSMVEVLAAPPAALIATAPCFNTPPPPPDPPPPLTAAQRVEDARAAIATAWDRQPPDDAASSSDIAAPLAELAQWAARGETETVLRAATSLVDNLLQGGTEDGASAWRVAVAARLRATEHDLMFTALGLLAKEAPGLPNPYLHEAILRAVVHLPQQVERESVQAQVLAALRSVDPRLLGKALAELTPPATTERLRGELLACLAVVEEQDRELVIDLLPDADRLALPPVLLVPKKQRVWPHGIVALLARTPTGRDELRGEFADPETLHWQLENLVAELPADLWSEMPLVGYALLVETKGKHRLCAADDGVDFDVAERIAKGSWPTSELQHELLGTTSGAWRLALAEALLRRGVHTLGLLPAAPELQLRLWEQALAVQPGDAAAAEALLTAYLDAWPAGELGAFVVAVVAASGAPAALARVSDRLTPVQCRAALQRLTVAERRQLLAAVGTRLPTPPTPATDDECQSLWDYGHRCDDIKAAVVALCRIDVGVEFVRARIAAGLDDQEHHTVVSAFAEAVGLDDETLQPPAGQPWLPTLLAAARSGVLRDWSAAERAQLEQMRRLRGVW